MLVGLLICALLFPAAMLPQSQVAVLHTEGVIHGFLVLRTLDGQAIADGDVSQVAHGDGSPVTCFFILRTPRSMKKRLCFLSATVSG
jgi:hypothetical protein